MGGLSIWHWLVVLLIVVVIFGTKRLTGGAKDLGNAVKEFKKAMREDEPAPPVPTQQDDAASRPKDDDDRSPPVVR